MFEPKGRRVGTTSLFVEILVVGFGASVWVSLFLLAAIDVQLNTVDLPAAAALPIIALVYVLGIVTDRAADALFQPIANRMMRVWFGSRDAYERAFVAVYREDGLRSQVEYSSHRLRIVRGYVLNALLTLPGIPLFLATNTFEGVDETTVGWASAIGVVVLLVAAVHAWYRLRAGQYRRLAGQSPLLTTEGSRPTSLVVATPVESTAPPPPSPPSIDK